MSVVEPRARFSEVPARLHAASTTTGQDTRRILLGLGYTWLDISAPRDEGIV